MPLRNPAAMVPFMEDEENGVAIGEGAAILAYLATKYACEDLYPSDLRKRALVDEYLHWHHRNTRNITLAYFATVVRRDIQMPVEIVKANIASATSSLKFLDFKLSSQVVLVLFLLHRRYFRYFQFL